MLSTVQQKAFEVAAIVEQVAGATGAAPSRVQGKPYLEVTGDRRALARYGLTAEDVLAVAEVGLGGKIDTTTIQGRERWPIQLRLDRAEREDLERLNSIPAVAMRNGGSIPLGQVAKTSRIQGPNEIASENGRLRVLVQTDVQNRDLGGFVDEVKNRIEKEVALPAGMTVEYSGQYENQIRARETLQIIMPVVLLIIFTVLYITYHSAAEAVHVILAVPFALTGGVLLQYFMGFNFSVAVWVGYIALFGTAIETGVVMVVYRRAMVTVVTPNGTDPNWGGSSASLRSRPDNTKKCSPSITPIARSVPAIARAIRPRIGGSRSCSKNKRAGLAK